jgi:hypothetical protein
MSTAVSYEFAWTPETLARVIDSDFKQTALLLPKEVFLANAGECVPLIKNEHGLLHMRYMGARMLEIQAELHGHDGQLGFWKEFQLVHRGRRSMESCFMPVQTTFTHPAELYDCPDLQSLGFGLSALHKSYLASRSLGQLFDITDRLPASTLE